MEKAVLDVMGLNISDLACSLSRSLEDCDGCGSEVSEAIFVSSSTVANKKLDLIIVLLPYPMENAEEREMFRVTSAVIQTRLCEKIIFSKCLKRVWEVKLG